jgi:small GTP-binding protein
MSRPRITLVVVGHKDHGKSTLIGRLLYDAQVIPPQRIDAIQAELHASGTPFAFAFLLDSLEEERQGGLTLDVVQIPFPSPRYLYTIIDCPGHQAFIRKMLTGASQADAAVLVASAKEGVEPQTRQHAYFLKALGIRQLVVAVTKMDAVAYREHAYHALCDALTPFLHDLNYHRVPMIPVSAMHGDNVYTATKHMAWYTGPTLIDALDDAIPPPMLPASLPLRAVVQDTYPYDGSHSIIACRVETGILRTGTAVIFNPLGQTGRLHRILVYDAEVDQAGPGDPVGLIVDGVDAVERGAVLSYPHDQPHVVMRFMAQVILFTDTPLHEGDNITLRYGTAERRCCVQQIQRELDPVRLTVRSQHPRHLSGHSVGEIEFSARVPLCLEKYSEIPPLGRFILEDATGPMAAGIVLETFP